MSHTDSFDLYLATERWQDCPVLWPEAASVGEIVPPEPCDPDFLLADGYLMHADAFTRIEQERSGLIGLQMWYWDGAEGTLRYVYDSAPTARDAYRRVERRRRLQRQEAKLPL